jgi:hypothetical protein
VIELDNLSPYRNSHLTTQFPAIRQSSQVFRAGSIEAPAARRRDHPPLRHAVDATVASRGAAHVPRFFHDVGVRRSASSLIAADPQGARGDRVGASSSCKRAVPGRSFGPCASASATTPLNDPLGLRCTTPSNN